ncbi:hypothetical protein ATANTOWER_004788 [Ataeniobius toweri]|uniref:G-protein coupled receptors family 1 profile domain-containing protein n=1 Tax=Ataeniobius toweri TaxID=208326 RepID=A0ABU7AY96_9TELE|nr:hypothetical protein [Ataeniobius toweri]
MRSLPFLFFLEVITDAWSPLQSFFFRPDPSSTREEKKSTSKLLEIGTSSPVSHYGISGSYGPEGPGTICSVQWQQRSVTARSYIICLFIFCLILPLLLMFFCYGRILLAVRTLTREVASVDQTQTEGRILLMVVTMVTGYLLCWIPYGVVAMLASFGRPGVVPPAATLIPSLLAKTSTVLNPVICVLLNNQFSRCFFHMISCRSEDSTCSVNISSSGGIWQQNLPREEQNTEPAILTFRDHQVQQPERVEMVDSKT